MKNKLFSKGLYVESLRQLKVAGIIALVLLLFSAVATPVVDYMMYSSDSINAVDTAAPNMEETAKQTVVNYEIILASLTDLMLWGPVFAVILFGQFNRRVASDFYHSLPYTRLCTYISFTAGVLTWLFAIGIMYSAASVTVHLCMPFMYIVSFAGMFDYILTCIAMIFLLTFGVICAMSLTGTVLSNIVVAGIIIFGPRTALIAICGAIESLAPVLSVSDSFFGVDFNVLFGMFSYTNDPFVGNLGKDIYSIILALGYLALGAYFFTVRKSETAGQTAGNKYLQDAIRIAVAFAISAVATILLITDTADISVILLYVFALIVYFVFELVTKKNFKSLLRTLPGIGIVAALNIVLALVCFGGAAIVHSYTPTADDIKGFYIMSDDPDYYMGDKSYSQYASSFTEKILISDGEAKEMVCEALAESIEESKTDRYYMYKIDEKGDRISYTEQTVKFVDKMGISRERSIWIRTEYVKKLGEAIMDVEGYRDIYMNLPEALERSVYVNSLGILSGTPSNVNCDELYESLREEVKSLDFATWYNALNSHSYEETDNTLMSITLTTKKDGVDIYIPVDRDITPKTHAKILEAFNEGAAEKAAAVKKDYGEYSKGKECYMSLSIAGVHDDGAKAWSWGAYPYFGGESYEGEDKDIEMAEYFISEFVKAAESGEKPKSGAYISVSVSFEEYDDTGRIKAYSEYTFVLPHIPELEIPSEYYYSY